jgi:hypothetical protein
MTGWPAARDQDVLGALFDEPGLPRWLRELFDLAHDGRVDTWDIQFFWSALAQNRLCLTPRANLVSNIGYAGTHGAGGLNLGMVTHDARVDELVHPRTMLPDVDYERRLYRDWLRAPRLSRRDRAASLLRSAVRATSWFAIRRARSRAA